MFKSLPTIKRTIQDFLSEEEGQINGKNILKTGSLLVSLSVGLSGLAVANDSLASCSHTSHGSHGSHGSHSSHSSHGSHGSHTAHASHGSHGSHVSHCSHVSHANHANDANITACY